jgi:RHS repeat-associated protein
VTYSDANNDGLIGALDIKQINSYYPFGLNMEGNFNGAGGTNKYQYNGKEWNDDFGLGLSDYGARFYDPAIARFASVDPLAEAMSNFSPYTYTLNSPINLTDPTGMAPVDQQEKKPSSGPPINRDRRFSPNMFSPNSARGDGQRGVNFDGEKPDLQTSRPRNVIAGGAGKKGGTGKNDWIRRGKGTTYEHVKEKGLTVAQAKEKYGSNVSEVVKDGYSYESKIGTRVTLETGGSWSQYQISTDPAYSPYKPAAVGIQASGTVSVGITSYSLAIGVAVGPGQLGGFYTTSVGIGNGSGVSLSGGLSAFWSDATNDNVAIDLSNLGGDGVSISGNAGPFAVGLATGANNNSLIPGADTYTTKSIGVGIPSSRGIKVETTNTVIGVINNR